MKKTLIFILLLITGNLVFGQVISIGSSSESLTIKTSPNTAIYAGDYDIHYYKPANYSNLTSPILWYVHGTGGDGTEGAAMLIDTAERRNALIVAPTMKTGWAYATDKYSDTISMCFYLIWSTEIFKHIYRHVLQRENRDSILVYFTGFSQGGQFVTRYMLIRQFDQDSIPVQMAVSVSPANYTFCTESFDGTEML